MVLFDISDLKLTPIDQNMPKPKSPERRTAKKHTGPKAKPRDEEVSTYEDIDEPIAPRKDRELARPSVTVNKVYPALINDLLRICIGEASDVRGAFKNRNRQKYKNIFDSYKDKLSERDYSIVKGALFYLYDFSRVNSIDKNSALWMLGIYEVPASQIISYTSKEVLKNIAKDHGLPYSNKKAEDLVESIRGVIDPSN